MVYSTRVLTKLDDIPPLEELADLVRTGHPTCRLTLEDGTEDEWLSLLISSDDGEEIAVLERNPVFDGSAGQDEIADFIEDTQDCQPATGVEWLHNYLDEVKTIYVFQHLQGAYSEEGSNALHDLRTALWKHGSAILQADHEGFTNEDGNHIVWQFSDSVSGAWSMAVLQEDTWHRFEMDLGDPEHREAFFRGELPPDISSVHLNR